MCHECCKTRRVRKPNEEEKKKLTHGLPSFELRRGLPENEAADGEEMKHDEEGEEERRRVRDSRREERVRFLGTHAAGNRRLHRRNLKNSGGGGRERKW